MALASLEAFKKGFSALKNHIQKHKTALEAWLQRKESIDTVDTEWLDKDANLIDKQRALEVPARLVQENSDTASGNEDQDDNTDIALRKVFDGDAFSNAPSPFHNLIKIRRTLMLCKWEGFEQNFKRNFENLKRWMIEVEICC
ncbi:hypothetical protein DFH08DRAFT_822369 [Mycena albidolilacea]|uniref:Uncharacterized protein n=1 Tax=Mycena albidolilacea TaxID=1033008 RepID=A0AAD6Z8L4_9AGAR|nr:hypothetical protein DFH08DRAFT_822369 [Mycena albidolilacea]